MNEPANYPLLREVAKHHQQTIQRPLKYLEIGVNEGGSAEAVLGTGTVESAILVDNWCYESSGLEKAKKRIGDNGSKAKFLTGDSKQVLPTINGQFDMIYVDGDHTAEGCGFDMQESLRLLAPDGVMVVDDVDHPEFPYLRKVVSEFAEKHKLALEIREVHCGMAIIKRSA